MVEDAELSLRNFPKSSSRQFKIMSLLLFEE